MEQSVIRDPPLSSRRRSRITRVYHRAGRRPDPLAPSGLRARYDEYRPSAPAYKVDTWNQSGSAPAAKLLKIRNSLLRPMNPCAGGKTPCGARENSLPRKDSKFATSRWNYCVKLSRNGGICMDCEQFPLQIRCYREFEMEIGSLALHAHGNAHAAANTERGQAFLGIAFGHFMQQRHQNARA